MKILHVIPAVAPRYGGPSAAVLGMCRALEGHGVESLLVSTDADGRNRLPVELTQPVPYQGVRAIFFSLQWSEAFKYSRPLANWLDENVRAFDVVHTHAVFSYSSLVAGRACRSNCVPYIVRPLGSLDPWSLNQRRFLKRLLWGGGVRKMLDGASAIHYTTAAEKRLAEDALALNSGVVIPLGVDQAAFQAPAEELRECLVPQEAPYILVLSRLHPKKNLELLLEAFSIVMRNDEFKKWTLVIAGDGEPAYVDLLKRLVPANVAGKVVFTGWLDGAQKAETLRRASLLLMTSYQENFALSLVEAMACGVPVLVSDRVNLANEIQEAGAGWVTNLEREGLVQKLTAALRSPGERNLRGQAGRNLARSRFAWPTVAAQLVQLYKSIAGQSRHNRPRIADADGRQPRVDG